MRWGEAGYGCQIATLTQSEERALFEWSERDAEPVDDLRGPKPPLSIEDKAPLSGSFIETENAVRFFSKDGDPELERWARIMFQRVRTDEELD
ncbi:MAG TPA: hypothetical protein VLK83_08870 [Rhodanobacteraceae bacterium]|jgi:hypothetical protein|nr:hypothetical protein [Rhodanobacteraceae bacterium]